MIHKTFKIPILYGDVHVFVSDDFRKTNSDYKLGLTDNYFGNEFEAISGKFFKPNGYSRYFMICNKDISEKSIIHESKHLVNFIFMDRGIELSLTNDEFECYFLGWVFEKLKSSLKK
jgi:hypothetical protein